MINSVTNKFENKSALILNEIINENDSSFNTSGHEYMYFAFAEQPFVTSTGVPATAR